MAYDLKYFDRDLMQTITHRIEADTVKKAIIAANRMLEGKNYTEPELYETTIFEESKP